VLDAAFLPWHRSGRVERDAFALARSAERVGLVTGGSRRILFVAVFLLPVLAAGTLLAATAGRSRWCGLAAVLSSFVAFAGATVVLRLGGTHPVGPWLACPLALLALVSGASLIARRSTE
jgi:hypothetical protein